MAFLAGYSKRKAIKYGTVFPGSNLSNFPKLLRIVGDTDIAAELSGGGGIAVTLADETTTVPFGLYDSSDLASGNAILRFLADPLTAASTGDVIGYIYYDHTQTTSEDKGGATVSYTAFMPLDQDPSGSAPQIYDWVTESFIGTTVGTMTSGDLVAGKVGEGLDLDGVNDGVSFSALGNAATTYSFSIWVKPNTPTEAYGAILTPFDGKSGYWLISTRKVTAYFLVDHLNNTALTDAAWSRVDVVVSSLAVQFYLNGATDGTATVFTNAGFTGIGVDGGSSGEPLKAIINDFKFITDTALSADWVAYAYQDDANNSDTVTLGAEQSAGGGPAFIAQKQRPILQAVNMASTF